jgi:hypothetical protein
MLYSKPYGTKPTKTPGIKSQSSSTTRTWAPTKTTKSESFPQDLRDKITKKRGTPTSCVIPKANPTKKCLQKLPTKIPRKISENHQKGEMSGDKETLYEPRRIFYTYHGWFIQGLESRPNIQPSLKVNHEALKLAYGKPKGREK